MQVSATPPTPASTSPSSRSWERSSGAPWKSASPRRAPGSRSGCDSPTGGALPSRAAVAPVLRSRGVRCEGLIEVINCNLAGRTASPQPPFSFRADELCQQPRGNISQIRFAHDNVPLDTTWADPSERGAVFASRPAAGLGAHERSPSPAGRGPSSSASNTATARPPCGPSTCGSSKARATPGFCGWTTWGTMATTTAST